VTVTRVWIGRCVSFERARVAIGIAVLELGLERRVRKPEFAL
jgi:hypothetical protein